MKKLLSIVLTICLMLTFTPLSVFNLTANAATSGYYTYEVSNNEATITDCDETISGDVVIPDTLDGYPVTSIGNSAFWLCSSLTSITIPDSVTSIGEAAFSNCTSLTSISISDSVTSIGEAAFTRCISLTSITIPDGVTSIGEAAFNGCSRLISITISDSVTSIGEAAFFWCSSLTSINVSSENTVYSSVDGILFDKNRTELICYPAGKTATAYNIPDSVISIGNDAFQNCSSLTSVTIGNSVINIGSYAFDDCTNLTSVAIGDSVTSMGDFDRCYSLTSIDVSSENIVYSSIDGVVFDKNKTKLIRYPSGKTATSYTIPDSVTSIANKAFYECSSLTSITIPDSVTSIASSAFSGCSSLTSITIPDSVTSIGQGVFWLCSSLTSITIPDSVTIIRSTVFSCCSSLTSITIPDSVTSVDGFAFYECNNLTNVYYTGTEAQKENITIGSSNDPLINATWYYNSCAHTYDNDSDAECSVCSGTRYYTYEVSDDEATITGCDTSISGDITIPDTLDGYPITSIGKYAFYNCSNLTNITIPDSVTSIGDGAFSYCRGLETVNIGKGVTSIGKSAFSGCTKLTSINIPNSVTSIANNAFYNCSSLTSIAISYGVTSIGDYAFYNCSSLISITIPNSVTSIGKKAFTRCTKLTSITIPDSVTSIGSYAFDFTNDLTSINVDENNTEYSSINGVLFNKDRNTLIKYPEGKTDSEYTIPNSVTNIGDQAFSYCNNLTSITISDSVASIDYQAFYSCTNLTSVTIPDSVTSIGDGVFLACNNLTSINVDENNTKYCSVGGVLFDKNKATLINYPAGKTSTAYTIPDSVTSIGGHAFYYCSNLTSITIPDSVTSIGDWAFYQCWNLTSITIPDSVTSIGGHAFYYCSNLTSITIPNSVTSIGSYAFNNCWNLTSITIPDGVTSIGEYAFNNCSSLKNVYYGGTETQKESITISEENNPLINATWYYNSCIPISYNGKEENVQWDDENKPILPKGYTDEQNKHFAIVGWTDKDGNKVDTSTLTVDNMIPLTAVVAEIPVAPTMLEADLIPANDPYLPTGNKYINGFYVQGTQIRVPSSDDGIVMGLRFVNVLDNNLLSALKEGATNVSYGTLVMLKKYHDGTDVTLDTQNVTKVSGENTFKRASEFNNQYLKYTVAITGITEEYFTEKFIVRPYITFTYNGEVVTLYGEQYEGASLYSAAKLAVAPDSIETQSVQDWIQENIVNVVEKIGDNDVPSDDVFA